jgi:hypothetical protein
MRRAFLLLVLCALVHPHPNLAREAGRLGAARHLGRRWQGREAGSSGAAAEEEGRGCCRIAASAALRGAQRGIGGLRGGSSDDGGGVRAAAPTTGQEMYNVAQAKFEAIIKGTRKGGGGGKGGGLWSCLLGILQAVSGGGDGDGRSKDDRLEEAAEMFERAANKFKLLKKWRQAGDALLRSGDCYARHSEMSFESGNKYAEAGSAYKNEDVSLAIQALRRAAAVSTEVEGAINFQVCFSNHTAEMKIHLTNGRRLDDEEACTHARTHARTHTHTHMHTRVYIHTHTHTHTHACTRTHARTHTHTHTHLVFGNLQRPRLTTSLLLSEGSKTAQGHRGYARGKRRLRGRRGRLRQGSWPLLSGRAQDRGGEHVSAHC